MSDSDSDSTDRSYPRPGQRTDDRFPLPIGAQASFRILDPVWEYHVGDVDALRDRLRRALEDYPELAGETVTIARDNPKQDRDAGAWPWSHIVFVPDDPPMTYVTLYHELAHLAIHQRIEAGDDVPKTSEEFCSLYALAKMPVDRIDESHVPYFGEPTVAKDRWPTIARRALAYREEHHDYIQQATEWFGL